MQGIIFQKEPYANHWTTRTKNICTLSSQRATRELYAKVSSHGAPVGVNAKGALCGSTKGSVTSKLLTNYKYSHSRDIGLQMYHLRSTFLAAYLLK